MQKRLNKLRITTASNWLFFAAITLSGCQTLAPAACPSDPAPPPELMEPPPTMYLLSPLLMYSPGSAHKQP